jgi:hypothetical protein
MRAPEDPPCDLAAHALQEHGQEAPHYAASRADAAETAGEHNTARAWRRAAALLLRRGDPGR